MFLEINTGGIASLALLLIVVIKVLVFDGLDTYLVYMRTQSPLLFALFIANLCILVFNLLLKITLTLTRFTKTRLQVYMAI